MAQVLIDPPIDDLKDFDRIALRSDETDRLRRHHQSQCSIAELKVNIDKPRRSEAEVVDLDGSVALARIRRSVGYEPQVRSMAFLHASVLVSPVHSAAWPMVPLPHLNLPVAPSTH